MTTKTTATAKKTVKATTPAAVIPAEAGPTLRDMLLDDPTAIHMVTDFFRCHCDGLGYDVTAEGMDATAGTLRGMMLVAESIKAYAAG